MDATERARLRRLAQSVMDARFEAAALAPDQVHERMVALNKAAGPARDLAHLMQAPGVLLLLDVVERLERYNEQLFAQLQDLLPLSDWPDSLRALAQDSTAAQEKQP